MSIRYLPVPAGTQLHTATLLLEPRYASRYWLVYYPAALHPAATGYSVETARRRARRVRKQLAVGFGLSSWVCWFDITTLRWFYEQDDGPPPA
jgi:hypothetical protein